MNLDMKIGPEALKEHPSCHPVELLAKIMLRKYLRALRSEMLFFQLRFEHPFFKESPVLVAGLNLMAQKLRRGTCTVAYGPGQIGVQFNFFKQDILSAEEIRRIKREIPYLCYEAEILAK